ncbi:dual serine/threonine and tyrosine protein kinase-like [Dendronephthya gigantea]|uniref:dual serine/threonine and tyrosine protein kinase-like n=1 Tax=Dendronephthya gigantea TaxID=151771 RepID=UPI00106A1C57|nr:dual serine/threonine and tyrosine protein kinase-like [Dendronephthya gigantea]
MAKKAEEYRRRCIAENRFHPFISKHFEEISINIEKMELEIPAIIRADEIIISGLIVEGEAMLRDAEKYAPIFAKCSDTKGELSIFAINDVLLSDVDFEDLECDLNSLLGHGSFADVFQGKMISEDKGSLNVAVKFGRDNCMKIADVGLSKNITEVTGTIAGTPLYMAPEIFAAEICDASADIYSFGLILWEMWYGEVVYSECHNIPLKKFSEKISDNYRPKIKTEAGTVTIPEYISLIKNCWPTEQLERLPADQCVVKLDAILVRHTT